MIRFAYDKTGSLLKQDAGEGYTVTGSYNELGQVTEVSSQEGTITYQYNDQGRQWIYGNPGKVQCRGFPEGLRRVPDD